MAEFKIIFSGRVKGSRLGKFMRFTVAHRAEDRNQAILRLYDTYTDIRIISVEELPDVELV